MKSKHFLLIFFFAFSNAIIYSQNNKPLYQVLIFKWSKTDTLDSKKLITVDSLGNVYVNTSRTNKKVNMKAFTKGINRFIENENVEKIARNFNPPRHAIIPKRNAQSLHINIFLLEDYHNENNEGERTHYSWKISGLKNTDTEYSLYTYLKKAEIELLKRLLL